MMTSIVDNTHDRDKDCCKFCLLVGGQPIVSAWQSQDETIASRVCAPSNLARSARDFNCAIRSAAALGLA
jgi:hypothetical protein